jgi:hypothetical protein
LPAKDSNFFALVNILMFDILLSDPRSLEQCNLGDGCGGHAPDKHTPQNGWVKNTCLCNGGPGGSGAGGELKTNFVVVPMAIMVKQEAHFNRTKLPFPATYMQERSIMAQRFNQSLIIEAPFGESVVGGWFSDAYRGLPWTGCTT